MASTDPKRDTKEHNTKEHKGRESKKAKEDMDYKETLAEEIGNYYGVEYGDDDQKFIKEISELREEKAKTDQNNDPQEMARIDGLIHEFRQHMDHGKVKLTDQQKSLEKKVKDEYEGVSISFPTEDTWELNVGGKVDSGNMSVPESAILASAQRLKKVPASN